MADKCLCCGKKLGLLNGKFSLNGVGEGDICHSCYDLLLPYYNGLHAADEDGLDIAIDDILNFTKKEFDSKGVTYVERIIQEFKNEMYMRNVDLLELRKEHMLTTGFTFEGYTILKYNGVVCGEIVLGTGWLSELSASVSDLFGIEADDFTKKLSTARTAAIDKLLLQSKCLGGNAVIGLNFNYINFQGNIMGVVANGTSVTIEQA